MGKSTSSPSPPPAPDPTATAQAQTSADINTAIAQGYINRTNQTTPFGTSTFSQIGTQDVNGNSVPQFEQNVTLAPAQQNLLNTQQGIQQGLANLGTQYVSQIPTTSFQANQFPTPGALDPSTLSQVPGQGDLQGFAQQQAQQQYTAQQALLQPQMDQQKESLDAQLANQGLAVGGQASNSAQGNFQRNQTLTDQSLAAQAEQTGMSQANQLFNQGLSGQAQQAQIQGQQYGQQLQNQNQNINLQQLQANSPINTLAALVQGSGAIQNPTFGNVPQTGVQSTDVLGAQGLNQNALQNTYQAQLAQQNSIYGGLAGLGGAALISQG